jgi:hypothetical protein
MSDKKDFFEDLLKEFDDPKDETSEEEQRQKNKDAEEARKRREAELKAKEEAEKKAKEESEAKEKEVEAKVDTPVAKEEKKPEPEKKTDQVNQLGEQLVQFKNRYPQVDLPALDKDTNFKKFINGKLLGKQDFIELYEDYIELTSSISGKTQEELKKNHEIKAKASSGTSKPAGKADAVAEVYSQDELDKLVKRIPLMSDNEVKKIQEKFNRSVEYYKKK